MRNWRRPYWEARGNSLSSSFSTHCLFLLFPQRIKQSFLRTRLRGNLVLFHIGNHLYLINEWWSQGPWLLTMTWYYSFIREIIAFLDSSIRKVFLTQNGPLCDLCLLVLVLHLSYRVPKLSSIITFKIIFELSFRPQAISSPVQHF